MTHPITPPPEKLLNKWVNKWHHYHGQDTYEMFLAKQAAQWGADQELEACCEWISGQDWTWTTAQLRAARRPKAPSLKEQALTALDHICVNHSKVTDHECTIRRALEQLND